MAMLEWKDVKFEVDEDGFMENPEEWTEEKLNQILDTFDSDLQERRHEHLEDIRSVAKELEIDKGLVDVLIGRLQSKPGFISRIR